MLQYYESHCAINRPSGPIFFCSCGHEFSLQISYIFGFNESNVIMKIAIHHRPGSFSDRWIAYCAKNGISYKIVNCYDSDIIHQLSDCDSLMWHHSNYDYRDALFARQLLFSLQKIDIKVFPDFDTNWHFDDKVAQKYLLEAIGAPLVPSFVFYSKKDAETWLKKTQFPKVFKLRGGSGSSNVKLVKNQKEAIRLINKAFGKGFPQFDKFTHLRFRYEIGRASCRERV